MLHQLSERSGCHTSTLLLSLHYCYHDTIVTLVIVIVIIHYCYYSTRPVLPDGIPSQRTQRRCRVG